jgi:hypothetical protein
MPKMNDAIARIQEKIEPKKLDPTMRFQLIENIITIVEERKPLTIERIFPLDSREVLTHSGNVDLEQSQCVNSGDHCLYKCPELAGASQDSHFIYCIMPTVMSEDTTICVLSLLQRKVISMQDAEPRYKYASSLLYTKLPPYERVDAFESSDNEDDMNGRIISLSMGTKKKITQLVKDRNQCFKNTYNNAFHEGQLMDRPIVLSSDCKAHIMVHQAVASPYLLSMTLQNEFNALVSSIVCIYATPYLICLH